MNGSRPWGKPRSSLGQTGRFLFNCTVKSPFCPISDSESMVMKFHGNVRLESRVNFLALFFASKPRIFMCGALELSGIVRANVRLNITMRMLSLSLTICPWDRWGSSLGRFSHKGRQENVYVFCVDWFYMFRVGWFFFRSLTIVVRAHRRS